MLNKFILEKHLSKTPVSFQRFIMNQYFMLNKKTEYDYIKYAQSLKIFKQNNCIFIHIPKTAGISLSKSLFGKDIDTNHISIRRFRLLFNSSEFNKYYKFTFVRNPWDKIFSCYRFLKKGGTTPYHSKWKDQVLNSYPDFNSFVKGWVNKKNIYSFSHFLPQFWFLTFYDFNLQVDFIGKFENLNEDFLKITNKLNINSDLLHLNKSDNIRKMYFDYYNQESIDIIADLYKEDIDLFKYDYKRT